MSVAVAFKVIVRGHDGIDRTMPRNCWSELEAQTFAELTVLVYFPGCTYRIEEQVI